MTKLVMSSLMLKIGIYRTTISHKTLPDNAKTSSDKSMWPRHVGDSPEMRPYKKASEIKNGQAYTVSNAPW